MSHNFFIKNELPAGKIVEFSRIPTGSTSANSPATQLVNNNLASISIAGSEILYIEVDNTFNNVSLKIDPVPGDLITQKSVTPGTGIGTVNISWKLFSNSNAKDGTPVNVTVGQDEPKIRKILLFAVAIAVAFYLLSGLVKEISEPLWVAIAGILVAILIGATIHYVIMKKKRIPLNI